ncbi:DUF4373 domain-containing protein [uncultured Rikenella sp.]|uniref:DUF4373 domain-containing protein n=1 Tax=uncultured Rikenella sp. TaxID=368003 RepID=UPI00272A44EC|nr:DUF4373 domain-containing protein [uncultured Rikenella sp.]
MNKDAYYFPHDSNAKDDPKCVLLIEQLGMEGYGIYWMLIETLRDQPGYRYPVALLPALARKYNTTVEKVKTVVYNYGLFIVEGDAIFFSQSLINRMLPLEEKRLKLSEAGRKGNQKRWGIPTGSPPDSREIATRSQVKENIVDKSKTDHSKVSLSDAPASDTERERFFEVFFFKNYTDPAGEVDRFLAHYEASGWMRNNGTRVVDRVALARTWTQKEPQQPPRFPPVFLEAWRTLYDEAQKKYPDTANILIRDLEGIGVEGDCLYLQCRNDSIRRLIEADRDYFRPCIRALTGGNKRLKYKERQKGCDIGSSQQSALGVVGTAIRR